MTDDSRPLSDPVVRFSDSNPFVLAALGLLHRAEQVDACLVTTRQAPARDGVPGRDSPQAVHDLDLALLGLVSLGRRLGQLAPPGTPAAEPATAEQDLLR